ncbi:MAG: tetratricopeptide repeat protein [Candidatus Eisenbacteria bacterium]
MTPKRIVSADLRWVLRRPWLVLLCGLAFGPAPSMARTLPRSTPRSLRSTTRDSRPRTTETSRPPRRSSRRRPSRRPDSSKPTTISASSSRNSPTSAGARDQYKKTLELDPDNTAAKRLLADALVQVGDFPGAVAAYQKAIAADSTRFDLYYSAADAASRAYTQPADLGKVVEAYRRALKKDPANPSAFNAALALAAAAAKMDDNIAALEGYQRAVKIKPDSPTAHYNCAVMLQKLKRNKEAAQQLESAIALKEPYGQAHYVLAGIYYNSLNDTEKALAHYEKAAADPGFNKADKAKQYADTIRDYIEKKAAAEAAKESGN